MKIRVYWDYPDIYTSGENDYEDVEVPDDASEEEIDEAAAKTALEHFEWSWEKKWAIG